MTDITADDEREAREWLRNAANEKLQRHAYGVSARYSPADDDKHRRTILALLSAAEAGMQETRTVPDDVVLTLVSQARQRARDAALEEAAKVAEALDPEKPANWLHSRHKIAFAIRALRRPT